MSQLSHPPLLSQQSKKKARLGRISFATATTSLLIGLLGLLSLGFAQVGIFHAFWGLSLLAASSTMGFITHCLGHARKALEEKQQD